jgi:hypothetical protein
VAALRAKHNEYKRRQREEMRRKGERLRHCLEAQQEVQVRLTTAVEQQQASTVV